MKFPKKNIMVKRFLWGKCANIIKKKKSVYDFYFVVGFGVECDLNFKRFALLYICEVILCNVSLCKLFQLL